MSMNQTGAFEQVVFQDSLFSPTRVVQRSLASGTVLELTLDPLPNERVRVVAYRRKRLGERWIADTTEVGRIYTWAQLSLKPSFASVFGR